MDTLAYASGVQIRQRVYQINRHKQIREHLLSFSQAPLEFINEVLANHAKEHAVRSSLYSYSLPSVLIIYVRAQILRSSEGEDTRLSSFYAQPAVEEAVQQYLSTQLTTVTESTEGAT